MKPIRSHARSQSARTSDQPVAPAPTPLHPRPKLLAGLSILFAVWIAFLLVLYFTTVSHS